ncbi:MAG: ATP-grasp domain-containing protein [Longimicrobiales bacterium]
MILLCGIPSEEPLRLVMDRLEENGAPYLLFNQRRFAEARFEFEVNATGVTGSISCAGRRCKLSDFTGVYLRFTDEQVLPELEKEAAGSPARQYARAIHDGIMRWVEIAPCRVVNRLLPMASNASKPFQAQLIQRYGFHSPDTLITDEPERVVAFVAEKGRVIYKSISGARSIVRTLEPADLPRLERIRWCPTQFQAFVEGTNVRVHTIGADVFATAIGTDATDYRYASQQVGEAAALTEYRLSDDVANRCLELARGLGLDFAGIDLKIAPDGDVYCFEVNPCPAYSYYEAHTGQPISVALANYLSGN